MSIKQIILTGVVISGGSLLGAAAGFAQFGIPTGKTISVQLSPTYPRPHDIVQATASTFSFDKDTALYSWYVDGKLINSGTGVFSVSFTAGALGTTKTVTVVARPQNSASLEASVTVRVSDLDLLWRADTYTGAGYRGKALPTQGSTVEITALPHFFVGGTALNTQSLTYTWSLDDRVQQGSSGRGRDTITMRLISSPDIEHKISATVNDDLRRIVQTKSVRIKVQRPQLNFYVQDPLRGPLYHNNLLVRPLEVNAGNEVHIVAVPFFFNLATLPIAHYMWAVDRTQLSGSAKDPLTLRYKTEVGSSAVQPVGLTIESPINPLEFLQNSFSIHVK